MDAMFVLVHSPLVGPLTWSPVAEYLRQRGLEAVVPEVRAPERSAEPYWKQHAGSAATVLAVIPESRPLVLVGHSGAGSLLPFIAQMTPHPVAAYLVVDAGLPHGGSSRLDEMEANAPEFATRFRAHLATGGRYPEWSEEDLRPLIPDDNLRRGLVAELQPRALDFWAEAFPPLPDWPDAPCAYMQFTASYGASVTHAQREGWSIRTFDAGHFHMLVDPAAVADGLVALHAAAAQHR